MNNITPVILCGGSGTRLWPLSRAGFPKQFLVLSGTSSLFQQAIERVNSIAAEDIAVGETLVVTNEEHRFLALDQLRELKSVSATLLLEPVGRNTAPALTLAALQATANGKTLFWSSRRQIKLSSTLQLLRLQLQQKCPRCRFRRNRNPRHHPDSPETGYGYIKRQGEPGQNGEYTVAQFAEKPSIATAQAYLENGEYAWNSGMFVLKASTWLKALQQFRPDIAAATQLAWSEKTVDAPFVRPSKAAFSAIPSDSIDYAVMEPISHPSHTGGGEGISQFAWCRLQQVGNDLGAWDAVWQVGDQDVNGNVTQGDTLTTDTTNTLIHATSRLVGTVGVNNLIIVETSDAILVADRSQSQHVKKLVIALEQLKREEHTLHRKVHRPWGWYDSIDEEERFK